MELLKLERCLACAATRYDRPWTSTGRRPGAGFSEARIYVGRAGTALACREVPREQIFRTEAITDLYVTGARLRLREARPLDGGPPMLRLKPQS